jgi:conjugal transfer pilus assembly protein TraW
MSRPRIKTALIPVMTRWAGLIVTIFWGCFIPCCELSAANLGVQGSVYEIQEVDGLELIMGRLREMQMNGEIENQQQTLKKRALTSIEKPSMVAGLKATQVPRTIEWDLSITVPYDIRGINGEIIQKAGFKLNPLTNSMSKKTLIFFDAEDEKQLNWALKEYHHQAGLSKLVLVNGSPLALMQQYHIPFYFDQAGSLSRYFKLEQVPAKVYQKGDKLIIAEVKV